MLCIIHVYEYIIIHVCIYNVKTLAFIGVIILACIIPNAVDGRYGVVT